MTLEISLAERIWYGVALFFDLIALFLLVRWLLKPDSSQ